MSEAYALEELVSVRKLYDESLTLPCYSWRNARVPSLVFRNPINCEDGEITINKIHKPLGMYPVNMLFFSQGYDIVDLLFRRGRKEGVCLESYIARKCGVEREVRKQGNLLVNTKGSCATHYYIKPTSASIST